jgi:hypothetical protein
MPRIEDDYGPRAPWSLIIFGAMMAVFTAVWLFQLWRPMALFADQGLLEIATRDSLHLRQAVGAHSRLGGFHPGPAYTYLLAPLYWLTGEAPRSLLLGTFLINAGALFAAVALVRARLGEVSARWAVAVAGLYLVMLGPANTWWLWNPNVVGPALVLTILLAADCTHGRIGSLIWAAVLGSFLVQAHVVMVVPVAALLVVAAVGFALAARARHRGKPRDESRSGTPPPRGARLALAFGGAMVLLLMWLPPVLEELLSGQGGGNLSHIFSVATGQVPPPTDWVPSHSLRESLGAVLRMLPVAITGQDDLPSSVVDLSDQPLPLVRLLASALLLGLALTVAVVGFRTRRWFIAVTALGSLVCAATAVVLETQTAGPLLQYAITWAAAIPVPMLMVATGLLPRRTTETRTVAAAGTVAAVLACGTFAVVATAGAPTTANTQPITLLADLKRAQLPEPINLTASSAVWPVRSAIVNLADKEGFPVFAGGQPPQFPQRLWGDGSGSQVVALPRTGPESTPPSGARLVGQTASYSLWLLDPVTGQRGDR